MKGIKAYSLCGDANGRIQVDGIKIIRLGMMVVEARHALSLPKWNHL